jgi:hypothetical protein
MTDTDTTQREVRWYDEGHGPITPWGRADVRTIYADGISSYETPSHGGFRLTKAREAELDAKLREVGLSAEQARMGYPAGWYEEDCSAYAIAFAWPEVWPGHTPAEALEGLRRWIR